jgi:hypothetical protein
MSRYSSYFPRAAARAARTTAMFAATALLLILVRIALYRLLGDDWAFNWRTATVFFAIVAATLFCVQFVYTFHTLRAAAPAEAILSSLKSAVANKARFPGFVAMEYYALILNRTFVVFVAPDALYGWKARGIITHLRPMYFQEYAQILSDPVLTRNLEAIQKLANLKGGFVIPRSQILAADLVRRNKWGMGGIPQSGRIHLRIAPASTREFILLGNVDAERVHQEILSGSFVAG